VPLTKNKGIQLELDMLENITYCIYLPSASLLPGDLSPSVSPKAKYREIYQPLQYDKDAFWSLSGKQKISRELTLKF
jgi:hypothetical protein